MNGNTFDGHWSYGDKREGQFFEKVTGREFFGKLAATGFLQVQTLASFFLYQLFRLMKAYCARASRRH
jgi:hypothetical protein